MSYIYELHIITVKHVCSYTIVSNYGYHYESMIHKSYPWFAWNLSKYLRNLAHQLSTLLDIVVQLTFPSPVEIVLNNHKNTL